MEGEVKERAESRYGQAERKGQKRTRGKAGEQTHTHTQMGSYWWETKQLWWGLFWGVLLMFQTKIWRKEKLERFSTSQQRCVAVKTGWEQTTFCTEAFLQPVYAACLATTTMFFTTFKVASISSLHHSDSGFEIQQVFIFTTSTHLNARAAD